MVNGIKKFLFVLIFCIPLVSVSQEFNDFRTIDSLTCQQFNNKQWKALIKTGKTGLNNEIDYYYLRIRKAIAEYETGNYFTANADFNKALKYSVNDKTAKAYKYYSLYLSGKKTMAYKSSKTYSSAQKKELKIKIKTVDNVYFFGGYAFSNNAAKNGSIDLLTTDSTNFGQQLLMGDQSYFHLGSSFNFSPSFSLFASVSFLNIKKQERFQYKTEKIYVKSTNLQGNGSYINTFGLQTKISERVYNDAIKQGEFYLNAKLQMKKGWSANLFGNLLYIQTKQYGITPVTSIKRDTLSYNKPTNTYMLINHQNTDYQIGMNDTSFMDWVVGFNLQKDFNYVVLNLGVTGSKIYFDNQYQANLSATYYPFGSFALYGTTGITYFNEPDAPIAKDASRLILMQLIGIQLAKWAWLEGEYVYGNLKNVNTKQGLVVYNLPDKINSCIGVKLYIFASHHLMINLQGLYYDKSTLYFNYSGEENSENLFNSNYQSFSIIGGIKWII
jgi:hypothetical protein